MYGPQMKGIYRHSFLLRAVKILISAQGIFKNSLVYLGLKVLSNLIQKKKKKVLSKWDLWEQWTSA